VSLISHHTTFSARIKVYTHGGVLYKVHWTVVYLISDIMIMVTVCITSLFINQW